MQSNKILKLFFHNSFIVAIIQYIMRYELDLHVRYTTALVTSNLCTMQELSYAMVLQPTLKS
jgi:hypothetical protein